jgi:lysine 2,3-aminomutase
MRPPKYLTSLALVPQLSDAERRDMALVSEKFVFRTNDYYQSLIDWNDPADPIRRIIMPDVSELSNWGILDASDEASFTVVPGLERKYESTALLLVTDVCGGYCRFCFRKRLFMEGNDETSPDVSAGVAYIRDHRTISNVLLTGGDPLTLSTRRLRDIIGQLMAIDHIGIIRVGTKMVAFNPHRITGDVGLLDLVRETTQRKQVYVMAHFNHPRELTAEAVDAVMALRLAGAVVVNQTPILRGVNDSSEVLATLFDRLSFIGVPPYYVFQCRPILGNEGYALPIEEAYETFTEAQRCVSGLAKTARFVMSHKTGKIEVVGKFDDTVFMRYHQAADAANVGRMFTLKSNAAACWLDDYEDAPLTIGSSPRSREREGALC